MQSTESIRVQGARVTSRTVALRRGKPRASPASRSQPLALGEPTLEPYFGALRSLPLLDRAQELALAREIDLLVIEHWRVLLSYRSALPTVALTVEHILRASPRALAALRDERQPARTRGPRKSPDRKVALAAARWLRQRDANGAALRATRNAVLSELAGDPKAQAYLARVARAHAAEQAAKGRFVAANLRLVISIANRYQRQLLPLADLVQEGNVGLIRAVEGFDHRRGLRFSTYATWWIRQGIRRALSDKGRLVRVPVHALDDLSRIARASGPIIARTGSAPDPRELALVTRMPAEKLAALSTEALLKSPVSLDRSGVTEDGDRSLHDTLPNTTDRAPDEEADLAAWRSVLERLLSRLAPIEAETLRLRFGLEGGDEHTLREVGEKYNLSRERIRQIQAEALAKLRGLLGPENERGLAA